MLLTRGLYDGFKSSSSQVNEYKIKEGSVVPTERLLIARVRYTPNKQLEQTEGMEESQTDILKVKTR